MGCWAVYHWGPVCGSHAITITGKCANACWHILQCFCEQIHAIGSITCTVQRAAERSREQQLSPHFTTPSARPATACQQVNRSVTTQIGKSSIKLRDSQARKPVLLAVVPDTLLLLHIRRVDLTTTTAGTINSRMKRARRIATYLRAGSILCTQVSGASTAYAKLKTCKCTA